jgi:probable poly-beta-1,6-N-acetyl-D-glucosamine export protein
MLRRLLPLSGLAIIGVVLNHCAGWGFNAMFWWTDRYSQVAVPNYDQIGSLAYYFLVFEKKLFIFAVPAFLFISGFIIAFTVRNNKISIHKEMMLGWFSSILIPYFIWCTLIFFGNFVISPDEHSTNYFLSFLTGDASPAFYYIPLLCQFYLLSPLLLHFARKNGFMLLTGTLFIQLAVLGVWYLDTFFLKVPAYLQTITHGYLFPGALFFFTLGVVGGIHEIKFRQILMRFRGWIFGLAGLFAVLFLVENWFLSSAFHYEVWTGDQTLTSTIYSVACILAFLSIEKLNPFFETNLKKIGKKSFGIFLLHGTILLIANKIIYHIAPMVLSTQFLLQPLLWITSLGIPMIFMIFVENTRLKPVYVYLFKN